MADVTVRVVDFETTGIPPKGEPNDHQVIEAAYHDLTFDKDDPNPKQYELSKGKELRFKPTRAIDFGAMGVHHITQEMAEESGVDQSELHGFLTEGHADIYCAHNAEYEQQFWNPEGTWWICTMKCAKWTFEDSPTFSNQGLRYFLGLDNYPDFDYARSLPAHAAMPDTYVTAHILHAMLNKGHEVKQLIQWSREYLRHLTVPIGEYYGKPWSVMDAGYLGWIVKKHDMAPDIKAAALAEIERRRK